jgi:glycosyltransferase involved in cell wall biosynthesis
LHQRPLDTLAATRQSGTRDHLTGDRGGNPRVLLLCPSRGLGGGIERYAATVEAVFEQRGVHCDRLDLRSAGEGGGAAQKLAFIRRVLRRVREAAEPTFLVLAHPNLLPVVPPAARSPHFAGAAVIVHGIEVWGKRARLTHRAMRRPDVHVVAVSNFTAGTLLQSSPASVLNPGLSRSWYDTLVTAGSRPRRPSDRVDITTAFRLDGWRDKGLETVLDAVRLLDDPRVHVTVCGSGPVPAELRRRVDSEPGCTLRPNLSDEELADQLAAADLFVLATRTRIGTEPHGEGFGLVLIEAQLAGTPVIAPAYGGSGEAFQRGLTGLAPTDESAESLARVLRELTADDALRRQMSSAAAEWATRRFAPDLYAGHAVETLLGRGYGR